MTGSLIAGVGHGVDRGKSARGENRSKASKTAGHGTGAMASRGSFNLLSPSFASEGRDWKLLRLTRKRPPPVCVPDLRVPLFCKMYGMADSCGTREPEFGKSWQTRQRGDEGRVRVLRQTKIRSGQRFYRLREKEKGESLLSKKKKSSKHAIAKNRDGNERTERSPQLSGDPQQREPVSPIPSPCSTGSAQHRTCCNLLLPLGSQPEREKNQICASRWAEGDGNRGFPAPADWTRTSLRRGQEQGFGI